MGTPLQCWKRFCAGTWRGREPRPDSCLLAPRSSSRKGHSPPLSQRSDRPQGLEQIPLARVEQKLSDPVHWPCWLGPVEAGSAHPVEAGSAHLAFVWGWGWHLIAVLPGPSLKWRPHLTGLLLFSLSGSTAPQIRERLCLLPVRCLLEAPWLAFLGPLVEQDVTQHIASS